MSGDLARYFPDGHWLGPVLYVVIAGFLASLARGFSGFGGALIFMPLASAAVGPQVGAPILLLVDGVMQFGLFRNAWRQARRREVAIMGLGALVGIPLGTLLLKHLDPTNLRWGIAVLILAMLALLMSGWRYHGNPTPRTTFGVGALAGFLSGVSQAAGPPVIVYWLGGRTAPVTIRANIIMFFFCTSAVAITSYLVAGLFGMEALLLALLTAPGYALGMFLGSRMFGLASERMFRGICFGLIAAAAIVSLPALDSVLR
ncbi:MAG: sulfite exporter TauE/SafE family protein [Dongiaceae bacterium]